MRPQWQRDALRRAILPLLLLVAGLIVAAATTGTAETVGWVIAGVGAVLAVGLVFLEVGYSEDRERARGRS